MHFNLTEFTIMRAIYISEIHHVTNRKMWIIQQANTYDRLIYIPWATKSIMLIYVTCLIADFKTKWNSNYIYCHYCLLCIY